jgi:hypothetical protein
VVAAFAALSGVAAGAANEREQRVAALAGIVAVDELSGHMAAYCDAKAPQAAAAVRTAWAEWRQRQGVEAARREIARVSNGRALPSGEADRARIAEKMAQEGPAEPVCTGLARSWAASSAMDLRKRFPDAYDAQGGVQTIPPDAGSAAAPARATEPSMPARPEGTVFSVAQLAALYERDEDDRRKAKNWRDGLPATPSLQGRIYVKGLVEKRGDDRHVIVHDDGPFTANMTVYPRRNLEAHVGRTVVYGGVIGKDSRYYALYLEQGRVVDDPSALQPARDVVVDGNLRRRPVDVARIRTAPGQGLAEKDMLGVLYSSALVPDGNGGYKPEDRAWLLLRDGTAYARLAFAPADLDVKASRELEPQHWLQWRQQGSGYQLRSRNDLGQPAPDWKDNKGRLVKPWATDQRIAGGFTTAAFYGSVALGGTYSKTTLSFGKDGRYEGSQFTQSGSGTMAALNGFSAGATTVANSKGTSTTVAGGRQDVTVTNQTRKDDGAERRGSYSLAGYTLEIRYDNGVVSRVLSFPVGDRSIWVGGQVYMIPSK